MAQVADTVAVYVEIGSKRVVAGALEWPGWCRVARDEAAALEALVAYGPRYARALGAAGVAFVAPADIAALAVSERLAGSGTTDFGAPGAAPAADARPMDAAALQRAEQILKACWQAFDAAVAAAAGRDLRKGPRGGGRDLDKIVEHVLDAERSYVGQLGWRWEQPPAEDLAERAQQVRQAALRALGAAARGELPTRGPRGGVYWTARYFTRRAAWHALDHAWEIEDRAL